MSDAVENYCAAHCDPPQRELLGLCRTSENPAIRVLAENLEWALDRIDDLKEVEEICAGLVHEKEDLKDEIKRLKAKLELAGSVAAKAINKL